MQSTLASSPDYELESMFGLNPYEWDESNVFSNTPCDYDICRENKNVELRNSNEFSENQTLEVCLESEQLVREKIIKKLFPCSQCEKKYTRWQNLNRHIQEAHLRIRFYCELCGHDFAQKSSLKTHIRFFHLGVQISCELCGKNFSRKDYLEKHVRYAHSVRDLCENTFTKKKKLKIRENPIIIRSETNYELLRKSACEKSSQKTNFANNISTNLFDALNYDCSSNPLNINEKLTGKNAKNLAIINDEYLQNNYKNDCGKNLDFANLRKHNDVGNSIETAISKDSNIIRKTESDLTENLNASSNSNIINLSLPILCPSSVVETIYDADNPNETQISPKSSQLDASVSGEKEKLQIHSDLARIKNIQYAYDLCEKNSYGKDTLKVRANSTHLKLQFKCDLCGKIFTTKGNLKTHADSMHLRTKYECALCGKVYRRRDALKDHVDSKHLKIQYKCDFCGIIYTRKDTLKVHKDAVHLRRLKERNLIGKAFNGKKVRSDLTYLKPPCKYEIRAKASHGKDKLKVRANSENLKLRYECNLCGKVFTTKGNMKTHADSMHLRTEYECDLCGKVYRRKDALKDHMDSKHLKVRYECELCGKVSTLPLRLLRKNVGEEDKLKKLHVRFCEKSFPTRNKLNFGKKQNNRTGRNDELSKLSACDDSSRKFWDIFIESD